MFKINRFLLFPILILMFSAACGSNDQSRNNQSVSAQITEIKGEVDHRKSEEDEFSKTSVGDEIEKNGQIQTGIDGRTRLDLSDESIVRIGPSSLFTLISLDGEPDDTVSKMELLAGKLWAILEGESLTIDTPSGVATVRGSFIGIVVDEDSSSVRVNCFEGLCSVKNNGGELDMTAGQAVDLLTIDTPPVIRSILPDDEEEFIKLNPEALDVAPAMTQTVEARSTSLSACDKPYFPIRQGASWSYASNTGDQITWMVAAVEGNTEYATATIESHYQGSGGSFDQTMVFDCSPDGLTATNFFFNNLPGIMVIEETSEGYGWYPPLESIGIGSSWTNVSNVEAEMEGIQVTLVFNRNFTTQGFENVSVSAGSFYSLKVSSNTTFTMVMQGITIPSSGPISETVWFGEGVGFTRSESLNPEGMNSVIELVSYSIP